MLARQTVGILMSGSIDWVSPRPSAARLIPFWRKHCGKPVNWPLTTTSIGPAGRRPPWLVPSAKPKPLFWKALPNQTSGSPPEKMPTPPVQLRAREDAEVVHVVGQADARQQDRIDVVEARRIVEAVAV